MLSENKVTVFDVDGNVRGNFEFDSEQLHEYDFDGEDFILLHLARRGSSEISDVFVLN